MSRFSQLNGHIPLPHGKADGLLADWSVCAFSQLNTLQSCPCIQADSPTPSLRPFSQLNVCVAPELARHQAKPLTSASAPDAKAFSQLNAPRVNALVLAGSRALSRQPFSQLSGHHSLPKDEAGEPSADHQSFAFSQLNAFDFLVAWSPASPSLCSEAFSQLNAWGTPELIRHLPKATLSSAALEGRVFSQLNAGVHAPLGQTRKDAFSEEAFSQLNALALVARSTCCSAARSRPHPTPHRPDFRGLKPRAYLHTTHEPRTTRGSVHLEPGIWRNRMK